jgi:two-component system NtrC family sensor kinase
VDDKEAIRKLLGRLLERRGFAVVEADSAAGAFAAGAAGDFALVLCDVRMPGTSGVDVYRRLVEQDPSVRDRFVFITGDTTAVEGHALVLPKPFTASDLDGVLGKIASL